ncbi:YfiM family lipoprotein [Yersinia intermedia]|uniref:YfiM family lipoprotein n=1 Tax=Yersinia intermedia TaxID=631 RepID=UPI001CFD8CD8|nr:YfiM family lipoprotein [Yersinia intermedia]MCB5315404.1 YfiM family lipoprotein [Yersinia intermedia]MCB5328740.1 YfiM family lipoprotein [Yersinia intermedia]
MWCPPYLRPLLIAPLFFLSSACTHMANDSWTGKDKAQHFLASAALAAAGTAYGENQNWSDAKSRNFGLLFSIGIGASKELYDSRQDGTGWSWKDFAWDVAGAITGYSLYQTVN